jgi:hypothetical protein
MVSSPPFFFFCAWHTLAYACMYAGTAEVPQDPSNPSRLSKKSLLKVIHRYHTDRNSSYGEEWLVLCEEVTSLPVLLMPLWLTYCFQDLEGAHCEVQHHERGRVERCAFHLLVFFYLMYS